MNEQSKAFEAWLENALSEKTLIGKNIIEQMDMVWQAAIASQAPRKALSDAEIFAIHDKTNDAESQILAFARAIEAASGPNAELVDALKGMLKEFNEGTVKGMVHDEFMACLNARAALAAAGEGE